MNPIETVKSSLRASTFPGLSLELHRPLQPEGVWFLDVQWRACNVEVEWSPQRGFGLSARDAAFGELPDEHLDGEMQVIDRITELLHHQGSTLSFEERSLAAVRERSGLTQREVALRLNIKQSGVSKLESRSDFKLSTLSDYISALGGTLDLQVVLPEATIKLTLEPCASVKPALSTSTSAPLGFKSVGDSKWTKTLASVSVEVSHRPSGFLNESGRWIAP